jgi:hypothetical protein
MLAKDLKVTDGAVAGAWIEPRLEGEIGTVSSQVPKGFEAYARVFHPASDPDGNQVRWAAVADALGTTAHREMQWHALIGLPGPFNFNDSKWPGGDPPTGSMDVPTFDALCEILATHTADPVHCFFGLCTIESWLDSFSPDELKPLLKLPMGRDHIVLTGPLAAIDQIVRDWSKGGPGSATFTFTSMVEGPSPEPTEPPSQTSQFDRTRREAPHLIWPADHTWLVVSEVDFDSTLVGGSGELIEAIVDSPEVEAWQVESTDSLAYDADKINTVPEEGD